jgi:hypothetical protein
MKWQTDRQRERRAWFCWETSVSRRKMREAANVIRRTRYDAGGHHCQCHSSGQRILEQYSGFWGPDLTLVRNNTLARVFNSATFKVAFWCRHKCRCPAPVPCSALDYFSSRVAVSTTLGRVIHWEHLLSKTTCWVMIKFSLPITSYDNLVMLTAFRMVNIFPFSYRSIIPLTIVPLEAHELLQWKLIHRIYCRRPPYSDATCDHIVKVQHLGTIFSFSIRKMHSLTVEWSGSRVHLSPRSFSGELKWLEYNCATIGAAFAGVVRVSAPKELNNHSNSSNNQWPWEWC